MGEWHDETGPEDKADTLEAAGERTNANAFARTELLTHSQKVEFVRALEEALDLRTVDGRDVWDCRHDHQHARRILGLMSLDTAQVDKVVAFFAEHGGYCDCETMLNVVCGD